MIDLEHLNSIFLSPNYRLFQNVDIRVENVEKIPPDETVIFAMNHTDRYNYWPFQYELWRMHYPFTTVWAKGKYYRSKAVGKFLDSCNVIPVPSMGYLNDCVGGCPVCLWRPSEVTACQLRVGAPVHHAPP